MIELVLMALLGSTALFSLIDGGSDSSNEEPTDEDPVPPTVGQQLFFEDEETVTGTDGDDTFVEDLGYREIDGERVTLEQVDLGAGNDTATVGSSPGTGTIINGGDGDDTLTSSGPSVVLNGDAGNDTINAGPADLAYGGAGDDIMSFENDDAHDATAVVDGGDGNDLLKIQKTLGGGPSYCQIWCLRAVGHAAIWSWFVASIPSLNVTPVMTLAR